DARRRGERLLLQQLGGRVAAFLVGRVQADAAGRQHRAANERRAVREVLQEERRTQVHSITRSARSRIDCGMLTPSARAAAMLIVRPIFRICSIGMLPASVPFRILSTKTASVL